MAINGALGSISRNEKIAGLPGQLPIRRGVTLTADDGTYPIGLLLTINSAEVAKPLQVVADEAIGAGDGAETTFAGTLAAAMPIEPGTVTITDGTETFTDDGCGRLVGDAGGSGTIRYDTGGYSLTFDAAPANEAAITGDYTTAVNGVLDRQVDTAYSTAGVAVVLGHAAKEVLKVGKTAQAAPSATLLRLMRKNNLFAI